MHRTSAVASIGLLVLCFIAVPPVNADWAPDGIAICMANSDQGDPQMIPDGAGGAIICWRDQRDYYNRLYAQRVSAEGSALWAADGVLLCSASTAQWYAELATDGSHGAIVTWMDERSSSYDVYAQRIDTSGTVRWDAGGLAISTARYDQTNPQIAYDGAGSAVIVWSDGRGLTGSPPPDVYAQRVDTLGSIMWTPDGIVISGGYRGQGNPQIVADGADGTVIAWQDLRNDNMDIYIQRCNVNGAGMWGGGVAACTAAGSQDVPMLAPDGTGGAVVTWHDYRSETDYDIYAQRGDGNGTVRWALNGVPVCDLASNQDQVQVVSDGESGAIFVWRDYRNGPGDIYAAGLTEYGTGVETILLPPARLAQNVPNPFNPTTRIIFTLDAPAAGSLRIYDAAGRLVRVLVEGDRAAGQHEELWDGRDASGGVSSGVYFCRLSAGPFSQTRKMILLR